MEENKIKYINTQNGKIEFEFDADVDIHAYFDNFISFLRATTFSDVVILKGLISSIYEMAKETTEFEMEWSDYLSKYGDFQGF